MPTLPNPRDKRLAVQVEDHPDYRNFEGTYPKASMAANGDDLG